MFENKYFEELDTEIYGVDNSLNVLQFSSLIEEAVPSGASLGTKSAS